MQIEELDKSIKSVEERMVERMEETYRLLNVKIFDNNIILFICIGILIFLASHNNDKKFEKLTLQNEELRKELLEIKVYQIKDK